MIYSKFPSVCSRYICHTYREFVKLSCDVLQGFFEDNPEDTERLLTRNRPRWRNLSCLEIAFRLKHRPFMAHEACKIPINKIWFGRISPENNSFRVWLEKNHLIIGLSVLVHFQCIETDHCFSDDRFCIFPWLIPMRAKIHGGTFHRLNWWKSGVTDILFILIFLIYVYQSDKLEPCRFQNSHAINNLNVFQNQTSCCVKICNKVVYRVVDFYTAPIMRFSHTMVRRI